MRDVVEEAERRIQLNDHAGALELLDGAEDEAAVLLLGVCRERLGDARGALRTWGELPGSAEARLRIGRLQSALGRYDLALPQLKAGLNLVRTEPQRITDLDRMTHDLLIEWSEIAHRQHDADLSDRLLRDAAHAWPASPRPLAVLARRSRDRDAVRRLVTAAMARVKTDELSEFIRQECADAVKIPEGDVILEVLSRHGLNDPAYKRALGAWRDGRRPPG